jgi:hypothetical protein
MDSPNFFGKKIRCPSNYRTFDIKKLISYIYSPLYSSFTYDIIHQPENTRDSFIIFFFFFKLYSTCKFLFFFLLFFILRKRNKKMCVDFLTMMNR